MHIYTANYLILVFLKVYVIDVMMLLFSIHYSIQKYRVHRNHAYDSVCNILLLGVGPFLHIGEERSLIHHASPQLVVDIIRTMSNDHQHAIRRL